MSYFVNFLGGRRQAPNGGLFVQTSSVTIANTTTETALTSTGKGSLVLPADFFVIGRGIRVRVMGVHSSSGNPTVTIKFKFGSTVIATITGTGGNGSNDNFNFYGELTCRTVGGSGTVFPQFFWEELHSNGLVAGSKSTTTVTINTSASQTMSVTFQWGTASASNTITATNIVIEAINP